MLIGAVADDMTGATDLCLMLSRAGLHTVQVIGVPSGDLPVEDAVVIALKSRNVPAVQAVDMSLAAAQALLDAGAGQLLFKYCSTFDSTDHGNIGQVTEALLGLTQVPLTIACPAYPANGRTVYKGHLFVGDQLLSDSPMKDHPLTPMRDANLVRVLQRQTRLPVGLLDAAIIRAGVDCVRSAFVAAQLAGKRILVTDTLTDADLITIGMACRDFALVTGGSGIALGMTAALGASSAPTPTRMDAPAGRSVILAGSCSQTTRGQIAAATAAGMPALKLDVERLAAGLQTAHEVADWVRTRSGTALVYSSADPETLARTQSVLGREAAGVVVEHTMADIARLLLVEGFTRFIIAGGETSGAVVDALGVTMLDIGPEIAPGVPWTRSRAGPDLALALKSGNFGAPDFFLKAWDLLYEEAPHD